MKHLIFRAATIFQITRTSQCFTLTPFSSNSCGSIIRQSDSILTINASVGKKQRRPQFLADDDHSTTSLRKSRDIRSKHRNEKKNKLNSLDNDVTHTPLTNREGTRQRQNIHFRTTNPRSLAVLALMKTSSINNSNNNKAAVLLESNPDYRSLHDERDKSFARMLVSTSQRRLGQIDKVLSHCCDSNYPPTRKKKDKYGIMVQATLRIGVAQILFMDTPAFAAVKETVEVLKRLESSSGGDRYRVPLAMIKFANAILRKVDREGHDILLHHTCLTDNLSPWLVRDWKRAWGEEKTMQIVKQLFDEDAYDHIDLTLNLPNGLCDAERNVEEAKLLQEFNDGGGGGIDNGELNENTKEGSIVLLPNGSLRIKRKGNVSTWPLYQEGKWWVQDVSSTLPAVALCNALQQRHDDLSSLHVVDMCAAPGGKTAQLLSAGFGCVTAVEGNAKRSRRLIENLKRLQLQDRCQVIVSKGQEWVPLTRKEEKEKSKGIESVVSGILVDVPCSATGTGSRRPDVLCKDGDIEHLIKIQEELANHCADNIIGPGGVMVYATCSLLKAESEDQVKKLISRGDKLEGHALMQTIPFTSGEIPGFDNAIDESGWLRVLPGTLGGDLNSCDGFFVARLLRVK